MMQRLRAGHIALLSLAFAACGSDDARSIDPTATYDVYGAHFEPGVAVPAPAVLAEADMYVGRDVVVEGVATDECAGAECVVAIESPGGGTIRVVQTEDLDLPETVSGRRFVAAGRLEADTAPDQTPVESPNALTTRDNRIPATADTLQNGSRYVLRATGIMVEKVRQDAPQGN